MFKKILSWFRPVEEVVPVRRDPVADANAALIAVTKRIPVVLGEES